MTDRLADAHRRIEAAASRLHARGLDDLALAAYPSSGDGPQVSTSGMSNPTEQAGITDRLSRARDHQLAVRLLEQAAALLERGEERMTPLVTGEQCPTVAVDEDTRTVVASCEGTVTHHATGRGLCERCDDWYSKPQNRGFHPGAEWIRDGNARLKHPCTCHDVTCPHDPGGCLGWLDAGCRTGQCGSCRSRRSRARERDRATVGTGGAWEWDDAS